MTEHCCFKVLALTSSRALSSGWLPGERGEGRASGAAAGQPLPAREMKGSLHQGKGLAEFPTEPNQDKPDLEVSSIESTCLLHGEK